MVDQTVELERVSMQWPKDLKEQVREKVGARGLTEFVLEAVIIHLEGGAERSTKQATEINELRWLVQQLADRVAIGGDLDVRKSGLMELELPSWVDTSGWPSEVAELVKPEPWQQEDEGIKQVECPQHKSTWHKEGAECPKCRLERRAQESETEEGPAPVAPVPARERLSGDDHLMKVMEMARKKGVDVASIDIKPASTIDPPEPKSEPEEEPSGLYVDDDDQAAEAEAERKAQEAIATMLEVEQIATTPEGICPNCGEELVDGECWTCE